MKRIILGAAVVLLAAGTAFAQLEIRNISSVSVDANFDGTYAIDINQVALFGLTDWLSGEIKLQRQDTPVLHETTISLAPVFVVGDRTYHIVRYGLGIGTGAEELNDAAGDQREFSHDLTVDANYETPRLYANLGARGSYYPAKDYWFVMPTAAVKVPLPASFDILGRYFFSYNSEEALGNALLVESSYQLADRFRIKAGATGTLDLRRPPGRPSADRLSEWELTGITGFTFQIRPTLALRYHLEYLGRLNLRSGLSTDNADGIRNILVLDATF